MYRDTLVSYGTISRYFHWVIGILMIALVALGFLLSEKVLKNWGIDTRLLYKIHFNFGALTLILVSFRLLWRLLNGFPTLNRKVPNWQHLGAKANFIFLYILMIGFPLSGILMRSFFGKSITYIGFLHIPAMPEFKMYATDLRFSHKIMGYAFLASFTFHVLGSLYHHFFLKDRTLKNMLGRT